MSVTSHLKYDQPDSTTYSNGEKRGITILVLCSCISSVAIIGLLTAISISAFRTTIRGYRDNNSFFRSCIFVCFVSLLLCNLIQGIASAISIVWIREMVVTNGQTCFLQGLLTQLADLGIAIWTMIILVLAFCHRTLMQKASEVASLAIFVCGWSIIAALLVLGPIAVDARKSSPFYAISGHWCSISPHYKIIQILLDHLITLVVALLCLILCLLLTLRLRKAVIPTGEHDFLPGTSETDATDCTAIDIESAHFSKWMLAYPVAYIICSLPFSIAQFASWAGHNVSFTVSVLCTAVYLLSGFANVLLFITIWTVASRPAYTVEQCILQSQPQVRESGLGHIQATPSGHKRGDSDATLVAEVKKTKLRPPEIIITRDSFETDDSLYSLHEEDLRSGRGISC